MAIGDAREWDRSGAVPPEQDGVVFVDLDEVTPELLEKVQPRIVLTAVLARRFDCIDVGHRLMESGFRGCLRLVTGRLPRPEMVLFELREHFPNLQVQLGEPLRTVELN